MDREESLRSFVPPSIQTHTDSELNVIQSLNHPNLPASEQFDLLRTIHAVPEKDRKGNAHVKQATETLRVHYQKMIFGLAQQWQDRLPLVDLVQEGNLGLLHAIGLFDFSFNTQFSTYARYWIRQRINRAGEQAGLIYVSVNTAGHIRRINQCYKRLSEANKPSPSVEEIVQDTGLTTPQVKQTLAAINSRNMSSLDQPLRSKNGPHGSQMDRLANSSNQETLETAVHRKQLHRMLEKAIVTSLASPNHVKDRRIIILRLRLGLVDGHMYTLEEAGRKLGINRERIRQQEKEAIPILRRYLQENEINPDDFITNETEPINPVAIIG